MAGDSPKKVISSLSWSAQVINLDPNNPEYNIILLYCVESILVAPARHCPDKLSTIFTFVWFWSQLPIRIDQTIQSCESNRDEINVSINQEKITTAANLQKIDVQGQSWFICLNKYILEINIKYSFWHSHSGKRMPSTWSFWQTHSRLLQKVLGTHSLMVMEYISRNN